MSLRGYGSRHGAIFNYSTLFDHSSISNLDAFEGIKSSSSSSMTDGTGTDQNQDEEEKKSIKKKLTINGVREQLRDFVFFHESKVHATHRSCYPVIRKKSILDQKRHSEKKSRSSETPTTDHGKGDNKYIYGERKRKGENHFKYGSAEIAKRQKVMRDVIRNYSGAHVTARPGHFGTSKNIVF
jgi:hypothetical protein